MIANENAFSVRTSEACDMRHEHARVLQRVGAHSGQHPPQRRLQSVSFDEHFHCALCINKYNIRYKQKLHVINEIQREKLHHIHRILCDGFR